MSSKLKMCFLTDMIYQQIDNIDFDGVYYKVEYAGKQFKFQFYWDHENSSFVNSNKHIIKGLIANGKFPYDNSNIFYDNNRLEKIINEANYPKTPKQKLDNLINFLFSIQESEGKEFDLNPDYDYEILISQLYFKTDDELILYMDTLLNLGYITFSRGFNVTTIRDISFKFNGLEYVVELQESGEKSKICFVAMSFSDDQIELRKALKQSIRDCDYDPILVDEIHFESDVTINDAIISSIKKCKFLIADFTEQKHGVYFEAGYALGKGKPVIYCCHHSDFKNTHFDTNHYPHIVYNDLDELREKLTYKIKAWID